MSIAYTDLKRMEDLPYDFFESAETMAANVDYFVVSAAGGAQSGCHQAHRSDPGVVGPPYSVAVVVGVINSDLQ